jgi:predicted ester cyclase
MTTEQNKATVLRFYAAFEANDQATLKELLAPDLKAYTHGAIGAQNREAHLQTIAGWCAAFGETHFAVEEQVAEGDSVANLVTMHAVHSRGEFMGLPESGKRIAVPAITIERVVDGRIVERRVSSDWFGMMQQLGLLPPPPAR